AQLEIHRAVGDRQQDRADRQDRCRRQEGGGVRFAHGVLSTTWVTPDAALALEGPDISVAPAESARAALPKMRNTTSVSPMPAPVTFSLCRFLEDVRAVAPAPGDTLHVDRLPDGRTTLILRVLGNGRGDVCLAGPRTRAQFKNATGIARAVKIRFKPGWSSSLFGVSASAVTDRIVPLEDIWGRAGREFSAELLAARSLPEVLDALSRAIAARMHEAIESTSA